MTKATKRVALGNTRCVELPARGEVGWLNRCTYDTFLIRQKVRGNSTCFCTWPEPESCRFGPLSRRSSFSLNYKISKIDGTNGHRLQIFPVQPPRRQAVSKRSPRPGHTCCFLERDSAVPCSCTLEWISLSFLTLIEIREADQIYFKSTYYSKHKIVHSVVCM